MILTSTPAIWSPPPPPTPDDDAKYRVIETGTGAIYLVDPLNQTIGEIYNAPDANWIVALLNSVTRESDAIIVTQAFQLLGQARAAIGQSLLQLDQMSCRKKTALVILCQTSTGERP